MFSEKNFLNKSLKSILLLFILLLYLPQITSAVSASDSKNVNYTITPAGIFPSSCVHEVPSGSYVIDNTTVMMPDKTVVHFKKCASNYNDKGTITPSNTSSSVPTTNGWVEYAYMFSLQAFDVQAVIGNWIVPPTPSKSNDGQVIYLFVGAEPLDGSKITQPVLAYVGGAGYSIASWYVAGNTVYKSPSVDVSAGDHLYGITANLGSSWSTYIQDDTNNRNSILNGNSLTSFIGKIATVTLEAYSVKSCADYPSTSSIIFDPVYVDTDAGRLTNPGWITSVNAMDCGESVQIVSPSRISLNLVTTTSTTTISTSTSTILTTSVTTTSTTSISTTSTTIPIITNPNGRTFYQPYPNPMSVSMSSGSSVYFCVAADPVQFQAGYSGWSWIEDVYDSYYSDIGHQSGNTCSISATGTPNQFDLAGIGARGYRVGGTYVTNPSISGTGGTAAFAPVTLSYAVPASGGAAIIIVVASATRNTDLVNSGSATPFNPNPPTGCSLVLLSQPYSTPGSTDFIWIFKCPSVGSGSYSLTADMPGMHNGDGVAISMAAYILTSTTSISTTTTTVSTTTTSTISSGGGGGGCCIRVMLPRNILDSISTLRGRLF